MIKIIKYMLLILNKRSLDVSYYIFCIFSVQGEIILMQNYNDCLLVWCHG